MGRTKPTDYSKLVIYKIKCNDQSVMDFYVGSTTCLKSRKCMHKKAVENSKLKIYETIRANGGWENWSMVEIELYPCNSSTEARIREQYWIDELQAKLNMRKAFVTEEYKKIYCEEYKKIYREEHKEELKEYFKNNYKEHKEEKLEKAKEYREANKEEIAEKAKIHYEANKKLFVEKNKIYYESNKDVILEKNKEIFTCNCGSTICKNDKARHERSLKHQNYLLSLSYVI
jgi:hypothetical protein